MKKLISAIALTAVLTLAGCASSSAAPASAADTSTRPDTYTSASLTRTRLADSDFDAAVEKLSASSNDLATKADSEKEGYKEPESTFAEVMSVNPDGSVNLSTIHAWKVENNGGTAELTVVMTDGQTIENLLDEGDRGSVMIHLDDGYYMLHIETEKVVTLEYSDDAYNAGKFNMSYSGKDAKLSEYTVTFKIYDIETSPVYMFG